MLLCKSNPFHFSLGYFLASRGLGALLETTPTIIAKEILISIAQNVCYKGRAPEPTRFQRERVDST